jgi:hypothetical protein
MAERHGAEALRGHDRAGAAQPAVLHGCRNYSQAVPSSSPRGRRPGPEAIGVHDRAPTDSGGRPLRGIGDLDYFPDLMATHRHLAPEARRVPGERPRPPVADAPRDPAFEDTHGGGTERYERMLGTADAHLYGTNVRRSAACGVSGPLIRANGVQDRSMLGQLLLDTRDQLRFDADDAFQRVDYFPG